MLPSRFTSSVTCGDPADVASRSVTPAFDVVLPFCTLVTRPVICTLPPSCWLTNWNASAVPPMSAPAPFTVNVFIAYDAEPATPTAPTSWFVHGHGSDPPPVVNRQTGLAVVPAAAFETICQ